MKKTTFIWLALALALVMVHPLQADTISYNIQENFVKADSGNPIDPLGIGSGTGTFILNFTLASPPVSVNSGLQYSEAFYNPDGLTLTLSGTNADGTYTPSSSLPSYLFNWFSSSGATLDQFFATLSSFEISGNQYDVEVGMEVPVSFWDDSEVPPLPKLLTQSNIEAYSGNIYYDNNLLYVRSNETVSSQVVPVLPTLWLLGSGLLGVVGWRKRRR